MKFKTTSKYIKENSYKLLSVGYCDMQSLLNYKEPIAYTAGVYGWNYDAYKIGDYTICTGYRCMPSNIRMADNWQLIDAYEQNAKKIIYSAIPYEAKIKTVKKYLLELLEILEESYIQGGKKHD